jgi:Uma2 family endonuclease
VLHLRLEKYGNTTWKQRLLARGVEPDGSYYIQNARNVVGNLNADVETLPPPDLAVEIDITSSSRKKFGIYAALGVPELWHYSGQSFRFYQLSKGKYAEVKGKRHDALWSSTRRSRTFDTDMPITSGSAPADARKAKIQGFPRLLSGQTRNEAES